VHTFILSFYAHMPPCGLWLVGAIYRVECRCAAPLEYKLASTPADQFVKPHTGPPGNMHSQLEGLGPNVLIIYYC
jgi:hypothetical protein